MSGYLVLTTTIYPCWHQRFCPHPTFRYKPAQLGPSSFLSWMDHEDRLSYPQWGHYVLSTLTWRYKTLKLFPSSLFKWSTQLLLQGPFPLILPHSSWEAQHDSPFGSQALPSIVVTFSPSQGPHQLPLTHVFFPSSSLSPSTMENLYPTSRWEASSYALISFSKVTSSPIKHFPHSPMPSVSWANELCTPLAIQGWTERWPVKKE